ncbi:hypothetical protein [Streptomyces sp. NPDC056010]|uniref:hypothetical protein n=1 Tax=Streptomyces sp. NPDC056010 TaxID=3345679 RepID=UPI0035DE110B
MSNANAINSLLRQLAVADRHHRDRGWEGMVKRKREAVRILEELASLNPRFHYRLISARFQLAGAISCARNQ